MTISKHMTRIVAIGTLKNPEYKEETGMMKGSVDTGKGNIQFVFFNAKETAQNPHTRALDFSTEFKEGDKVFITGQDSRNYSDTKGIYYESIQGWDYRKAEDEEAPRWVYVYIADVKELEDGIMTLSFINYKDEETLFPINIEKAKIDGTLEVGARIKVKGEIFSGLKMDFYGDGDFVTERTAVEVKVLHSAMEMEEEEAKQAAGNSDDAMWD